MSVSWSSAADALLPGSPCRTREVNGVSTRVTTHMLDRAARSREPCAAPAPRDHEVVFSSDS